MSPYHPTNTNFKSHEYPQTSHWWHPRPVPVSDPVGSLGKPGPNETDGIEEIATAQEFRQKVDVVFVLIQENMGLYWWIDGGLMEVRYCLVCFDMVSC